jgi:hypothetical protein
MSRPTECSTLLVVKCRVGSLYRRYTPRTSIDTPPGETAIWMVGTAGTVGTDARSVDQAGLLEAGRFPLILFQVGTNGNRAIFIETVNRWWPPDCRQLIMIDAPASRSSPCSNLASICSESVGVGIQTCLHSK